MKTVHSLCLLVALACVPASAQRPTAPKNSPEQVVDQYFANMKEGSIFTREGWRKTAALFERSSATPLTQVVHVLPNVSKFLQPASGLQRRGNRVMVDCGAGELGTVDSLLRFRRAPDHMLHACPLVLTDTHWLIGPDRTTKAINGPLEWRMEGSLTERFATVDATIVYVAQMRDKASDPTIKRNAQRTVAILKRMRGN